MREITRRENGNTSTARKVREKKKEEVNHLPFECAVGTYAMTCILVAPRVIMMFSRNRAVNLTFIIS